MLDGGVEAIVVGVRLDGRVYRSSGSFPSHRGIREAFVGKGLHSEVYGFNWLL